MNPIEHLVSGAVEECREPQSRETRTFFRIVSFSTAAALGCAVAATQSLRLGPSGFSFHVSIATVAAFLAGATAALFYWRVAIKSPQDAYHASAVLAVAGAILFFYPLRFVSPAKLLEIGIGLGTAACALSVVGFLLWKVGRFLDSDARRVELAQNHVGANALHANI